MSREIQVKQGKYDFEISLIMDCEEEQKICLYQQNLLQFDTIQDIEEYIVHLTKAKDAFNELL